MEVLGWSYLSYFQFFINILTINVFLNTKQTRPQHTRNRGSTPSTSARRRGGDRFESKSDTTSHIQTLEIVSTAAISCARQKQLEQGKCFVQNRPTPYQS